MSLHVKVLAEWADKNEPCTCCGAVWDECPPILRFTIFAGEAFGPTEVLCMRCLAGGNALEARVEQPKVQPQAPSRRIVKRTRKEEFELAANVDGHRQPASGALPGKKGDGLLKGVARWDSKMCFSKKVSWDLDDLHKISGEAAYGEIPAIITAYTDRATLQIKERWVTIPYQVWEERILNAPSDDR